MFNFRDLFQWERFITPSIIKLFFWLAVVIIDPVRPFRPCLGARHHGGQRRRRHIHDRWCSLLGMIVGIMFARIVAEFILMVFRINEHLGAIRKRGEM